MKMRHLYIILATLTVLGAGVIYFLYTHSATNLTIDSSTPKPFSEKKTIVAFGDSLTAGYGIPLSDNYPNQLKEVLQNAGYTYDVIYVAESGETTSYAVQNIDTVIAFEPRIVLLEFGANDALKGLPPASARENLRIVIKKLLEKQIKVVLVGVTPISLLPIPNKAEYAQIYPDLATEFGLPLVKSFLDGISLQSEYTIEDRIHPNKAGYTKAIEDNLWPVLKKELVK